MGDTLKRLHVQKLPAPSFTKLSVNNLNNYRKKPAQRLFDDYNDDERLEYLEIMQESLVYGLAKALEAKAPPLTLRSTYPAAYNPAPGRCVWTWETVRELKGDEPFEMGYLQTLMLRPSGALPEKLQKISPRMAWMLTGMRLRELHRCMIAVQEEAMEDGPSSYDVLYHLMNSIPYVGEPNHGIAARRYLDRPKIEPAKNSRRNIYQEWLCRIPHIGRGGRPRTDVANKRPLAELAAENPPYPSDLSPWLESLVEMGLERAKYYLEHLPEDTLRDPAKMEWMVQQREIQQRATHRFVHDAWESIYTDLTVTDTGYETRAVAFMAYCMIVDLCHRRHRRYLTAWSAGDLMPLCRMTGVSPAVFVRFSLDHRYRCGWMPIQESEIRLMVEMIQRIKIPAARRVANQNRDALVEEMKILADHAMQAGPMDERLQRIVDLADMPEWGIRGEDDLPEGVDELGW